MVTLGSFRRRRVRTSGSAGMKRERGASGPQARLKAEERGGGDSQKAELWIHLDPTSQGT